MRPYRHHVFICEGKRCVAKGGAEVLEEFKDMVKHGGLEGVRVTRCGCVKVCKETHEEGEYSPVVVVYPEGIWYRNVTTDDVAEIAREHLQKGRVVERLLHYRHGGG